MRFRVVSALVAAAFVLAVAGAADARTANSSSVGSRGSRTTERVIDRSVTPSTQGVLQLPSKSGSASSSGSTVPPSVQRAPARESVESAPLSSSGTTAGQQQPMYRSDALNGSGAAGMTPGSAPLRQPGFFQRNPMLGGIMGGLIGAGIGSALFGHSPALAAASEAAPGASMLGTVLQVALIGGLAWLAFQMFRRRRPQESHVAHGYTMDRLSAFDRRQPDLLSPPKAAEYGSHGGGLSLDPADRLGGSLPGPRLGSVPSVGHPHHGGIPSIEARHEPSFAPSPISRTQTVENFREPSFSTSSSSAAVPSSLPRADKEFEVGATDQEQFGTLLQAVQSAWSKGDLAALRRVVTPEVLAFLSEDLARDASRGVRNVVEDVVLLKGVVTESWRDGDLEFSTAKMTFSCRDFTIRLQDEKIVDGDPRKAVEATELWTFVRSSDGGRWLLSAIEQA